MDAVENFTNSLGVANIKKWMVAGASKVNKQKKLILINQLFYLNLF